MSNQRVELTYEQLEKVFKNTSSNVLDYYFNKEGLCGWGCEKKGGTLRLWHFCEKSVEEQYIIVTCAECDNRESLGSTALSEKELFLVRLLYTK